MIQLKNKFVQEEIVDENGKQVGVLQFNPEDTATYKKFIELSKRLAEGYRKIDGIESELKIPKGEFKTVEDIENASGFLDTLDKGIDISIDMFDEICRGFDEIFGKGTCEIFTRGSKDTELLLPLIDGTMPHFKKAREGISSKYLVDGKKDDELQ